MLDPQAAALIQLMTDRQVPPTHTLSPADARRMYLDRRFYTQPKPPPVGSVQNLATPGGVPLRLYKPEGSAEGLAAGALPVLVYFHGGGWTMGDLDTHDVLCRQLCAGAGVAVVSVDYRMGPEHRFPAAVDDCVAATRWLQAQDTATALGLDARRVAVGGDSAGGNLAAVVALSLRDLQGGAGVGRAADAADASDGAHAAHAAHATDSAAAAQPAPLAFQLLIYPATDMRCQAESHFRSGQGYVLTADTVTYFRGHYMADPAQYSDWRASPLLASSHHHLPQALVLTAGYDPLLDEGRQYADTLSAAGNRVQYVCFERQIHGFVPMGRVLDEARSAVALCCAVLKEALAADA